MNVNGIHFPEDQIAHFCRRHDVRKLSIFGSILRQDFGPESDVDILVEFQPGRTPGMFGFGAMILELNEMIGRRVDLRTPFDLSRYFRPFVLKEARTLHAA
ncbi:MAG: nucleotidyltransferase family protein [Phycisphaeraceae bacterium]|nr:nucleotidyltransferase family protein [Phycisphaeraceae bacterium]